jgi:hypothetical protein
LSEETFEKIVNLYSISTKFKSGYSLPLTLEITMGAGRSGQEHSGQWPENLFTGLNDFGHSGL